MDFLQDIPLVLGSASVFRKATLGLIKADFSVVSPDIDERAIRSPDATVLTMNIALAKSAAVRARVTDPGAVIITADQVVVLDGRILEKPETVDQARDWLLAYAERPALCVTSVVVHDCLTGRTFKGTESATVQFRPSLTGAIDALLADGAVLTASGALIHEHPLVAPHVERMVRVPAEAAVAGYAFAASAIDEELATHTCVEGLPLQLLVYLLAKAAFWRTCGDG